MALLLATLLAFTASAEHVCKGGWGKPECCCMQENSTDPAKWDAAVKRLSEKGRNASHGMLGCRTYNSDECNEYPLSCRRKWCYVDETKCRLNHTLCGDSGPGSFQVHCRWRQGTESRHSTDESLYFSYETCGNLGNYKEGSGFEKWLSNFSIMAAYHRDEYSPVQKKMTEVIDLAVKEFAFMEDIKGLHLVKPQLHKFKGEDNRWYTTESERVVNAIYNDPNETESLLPNEYNYCLHDVAVGNLDLCVVDMWVTPQRSSLVQFLPPVRFDHFYLVQNVRSSLDFWALSKPFDTDAWLGISVFLVLAFLLYMINAVGRTQTEAAGDEEVGAGCVGACRRHADAGLGQLILGDPGTPNKVFFIGFALFTFVFGAVYTANLAEFLVRQKLKSSETFLERTQGQKICVDELVLEELNATYKRPREAWKVVKDSSNTIPSLLYEEECEGAILAEYVVSDMHAGKHGHTKQLCNFDVVEPHLVLTFAVSFPVNTYLSPGLSWATTKVLSNLDKVDPLPSDCPTYEEKVLGLKDLWSALGIPIAIMVLATLLRNYKPLWRMWKGAWAELSAVCGPWLWQACGDPAFEHCWKPFSTTYGPRCDSYRTRCLGACRAGAQRCLGGATWMWALCCWAGRTILHTASTRLKASCRAACRCTCRLLAAACGLSQQAKPADEPPESPPAEGLPPTLLERLKRWHGYGPGQEMASESAK